ncbi:cytochrome c [Altererythrobacter sp. Root672]|uniref:cytochrome c n=1 Tax=Altererythrobacter sp. Root672 TaxID=1736584 RepID=UPI000A6BECE7|nr:cytochrome c [Altererythrobacter sp. Root672]
MKALLRISTIGLFPLALVACNQASEPAPEATTATPSAAPAIKLPVSLNAAMVSMVDHSADYIFALGNDDLPRNDRDWLLVRNSAFEMMLAGTVTQIPGTGAFDEEWTKNPEWQTLAKQLTAHGAEALKLAEAKSTNVQEWRALGDRLVQTCLQCHEKFKPEIPSEGILKGSTERQSRGESIFS